MCFSNNMAYLISTKHVYQYTTLLSIQNYLVKGIYWFVDRIIIINEGWNCVNYIQVSHVLWKREMCQGNSKNND